MKHIVLIVFALVILSLPSLVLANGVDDQGNPNDPFTNIHANACYEGATMEGKCTTELEWIAGWYYHRYEAGIFTAEQIPSWLSWIIPPNPDDSTIPDSPAGLSGFCFAGNSGNSFLYSGVPNVASNLAEYSSSTNCTGSFTIGILHFVIDSTTVPDVDLACSAIFPTYILNPLSLWAPSAPANLIRCNYF